MVLVYVVVVVVVVVVETRVIMTRSLVGLLL